MIHCYASRAHYYTHLQPIFAALPPDLVGDRMSPRSSDGWGYVRPGPIDRADLVLVAADADSRKMSRSRVVYVEHGAGQSYGGDARSAGHGSYSGGVGHDNTALFICPSETVAARWRKAYQDTPTAAVGCPKLDRFWNVPRGTSAQPIVAFSFHWDNPLCEESRTALPYWRPHLKDAVAVLRQSGVRVIGHGHPRARNDLWRLWAALDVPYVADERDVLGHCDVFVADNTSALYEHAAIGTPVVVLNAPWYRREVNHGLRFWDAIPGRQVDFRPQLLPAIFDALEDDAWDAEDRQRAVRAAYAHVDGQATQRAVKAILEVI